jgi:hypothetical protein
MVEPEYHAGKRHASLATNMAQLTHNDRFEVRHAVHGALSARALWPAGAPGALPVCLFLYGGGGSEETLSALEPLLAQAWSSGALAPLLIGCLGVPPFCFYLEDPARGEHWQSAAANSLAAARGLPVGCATRRSCAPVWGR